MSYAALPLVSVVTCIALFGCGATSAGDAGDPIEPQPGAGGHGAASGSGGAGAAGAAGAAAGGGLGGGGAAGSGGVPVVDGTIGIVVIDVQEAFVGSAKNADMAGIIDRTKATFQLATDQVVPFFITFEGSEQGDHGLHAPLQPMLPAQAKDFVKTTFAATGQPAFHDALKQSGLSHLVVLGAETDVCVMQTVLGLRQMGFTVLLEHDAVFTSETNTSPALQRMQQAGALPVSQAEVAGYVAKPSALPKGNDAPVRIVNPLRMGVVLNNFTDAALAGSADPLTTQKSARLRELLLVSEWFELPVYVADVNAGLPSAFTSYFQGQLRPISGIEQDGLVDQLVFAGTDAGLPTSLSSWMTSRELFVMVDALVALGAPAAQKDMLKPFFDGGIVPTTYKSFYYDMTRSVDLAQWPSQKWVQKYDEYYAITQAPEDLPAMPPY